MKIVKIIALAATLVAGVSVANASPFNVMNNFQSLNAIQEAEGATVLSVTPGEARYLEIDTDVASIRARVQNNRHLVESIELQGFTVEQIVGASGGQTDLTLYAL